MSKILIYLLLITSLFLVSSDFVYAQPEINSVNGNISDGEIISVGGVGFGDNGPNVVLFDDFERGIHGNAVTLSDLPIGSWDKGVHNPSYINDGNGNLAVLLVDGATQRQLQAAFTATTEIFISYRVQVPTGYNFPDAWAPETWPNTSAWKLTWLLEHETSYLSENDVCIPTSVGRFMIAGNSGVPSNGESSHFRTGENSGDDRWFSFTGWNRYSAYLKGGEPDPQSDPGTIWAQGMSAEFGVKEFGPEYDYILMALGEGFWSRLNISGWHRADDTNSRGIYDDIYIATGEYAQARIEIGNNPVYENSTNLAISTVDDWSDDEINVTIRQGSFEEGESVYLFVIDADGVVSEGYPITSGSTSSDTTPPSAPQGLAVS